MPITSPDMLTSGPPELPGLMAASVCRKSSNGPWPIERPLALMMPAVTVCWRPNGEPMASTQSPTFSLSESPERGGGVGSAALEPEHGEIRPPVDARPPWLCTSCRRPSRLDLAGPLDHVGVGEHGAGRIDDHARAEAPPAPRRSGVVAEEPPEELVAEELLDRACGRAPRVTVLMLTTAGATVSATWEKLPDGTGSAAGTTAP